MCPRLRAPPPPPAPPTLVAGFPRAKYTQEATMLQVLPSSPSPPSCAGGPRGLGWTQGPAFNQPLMEGIKARLSTAAGPATQLPLSFPPGTSGAPNFFARSLGETFPLPGKLFFCVPYWPTPSLNYFDLCCGEGEFSFLSARQRLATACG